ncbi:MAG: hypothetical protein JWN45_1663 [Acidobacteriaceae bacterium]|nr:hypothetical protein [Acidobacteriaceae bacterium]
MSFTNPFQDVLTDAADRARQYLQSIHERHVGVPEEAPKDFHIRNPEQQCRPTVRSVTTPVKGCNDALKALHLLEPSNIGAICSNVGFSGADVCGCGCDIRHSSTVGLNSLVATRTTDVSTCSGTVQYPLTD